MVYTIPRGSKCLVSTSNKRTSIRDKNGWLLDNVNTLLPNGNSESKESGITMMQGVYDKEKKTMYLTDLITWNNELFIDNTAELRLMALISKIKSNPQLSKISGSLNEIRFRMPQIMICSKSTIESLYYGLYTDISKPQFTSEYGKLVTYAHRHNLLPLLELTAESIRTEQGAIKLCCSFGVDNMNEYYLKNGLAFILRNGNYFFGYNESTLQWKDELSSYRYEKLRKTPLIAHLKYTEDKKLVTQDGYIITMTDPQIKQLNTGNIYVFSYEAVDVKRPYATFEGLKYLKPSAKVVWTSMSDILFMLLTRKREMTYQVLIQELQRQEEVYRENTSNH